MKKNFWNNKKVFITGHTGFKGSWLTLWLKKLGADVSGYSLKPKKKSLFVDANISNGIESNYENILNFRKLSNQIKKFSPEIVFHLAAQPLVKLSYNNPRKTYSTNIFGTINLLESLKNCESVKSIIIVTTDKVYENRQTRRGYNETDMLGGYDPYSSSKACCEIITNSYRSSFFEKKGWSPGIATARAGNVIGGGDYSEFRLIPDLFKSIQNQKVLKIRNIKSIRPWQHVMEALKGYLRLAEQLYFNSEKFSEAWNFGPNKEGCKDVGWVLSQFRKNWNFSISHIQQNNVYESEMLKLDISKAIKELKWKPILSLNEAIDLTSEWFRKKFSGEFSENILLDQINSYEQKYIESIR